MKRWILALLINECLLAGPVYCQANKSPPEDPAHDQLRAVRKGLEEAFNKRDIDRLVQFLHPNVVVIWQNGEVNRGRDQVRAYYQRMLLDKNGIVESLMVDLDVAELSILYGKDKETAIAYGTMEDRYKLRDGMEFNLHSRWTATLVKEQDQWLIVSAQAGSNVFENEVLFLAVKKTAYWTGGIAGAVGLAIGMIVIALLKRRKQTGETKPS